jgi:3-phosphoglycerate kinase
MIREAGLKPGVTAHMPEVVQYCDLNGYDVETYIQIFNCLGFMMQVEIESVIRIIHGAKKPVITIKPMAAGRVSPYVGLTFNWNVLREKDMVAIGCLNEFEAEEDIEISRAALERRLPDIEGRASPAAQSIIV